MERKAPYEMENVWQGHESVLEYVAYSRSKVSSDGFGTVCETVVSLRPLKSARTTIPTMSRTT